MAKLLAAPEIVANPDYQRVADLLDVLGRIRLRLAELENRINTEQIDLIDRYREEVVTLQAEEETAVRLLMRDHRRIAHPVSRAVRRLVSEISTARTVTP